VKPAAFAYLRAGTIDEALAALYQHGDAARVLAGGQSLVPMLNMRLARPALLVDISRIVSLAKLRREGELVVIPAAMRQAALGALGATVPLLAAALPFVGHSQTRTRGTVCGSIAHADPSAELPLCLLALGGEVRLSTQRRRRALPAAAFFTGTMQTQREDDEMIEAIAFPRRPGSGQAFAEVARRHGDFAIVACAAVADARGMRLAVGGVADRPVARDLPPLDGSALDDALNDFAWELGAIDDLHATARYRRDLVRRLGRRVLEEALACRS
jgi:2-furoyl-CoA dehydrogenase FAD binding subunit